MTKLTAIAVAGAFATLGAGAFMLNHKPAPKAGTALPSSDAELRAELARLRGEVQGLSAAQRVDRASLQLANGNASKPEAGQAPDQVIPAVHEPIDANQLIADRERATREAVAKIGDRFDTLIASETVDTRWRTETVRNVEAAFTDVANSKVVSTDCGSRLCRVVVERTSVDELRDLPKSIADRAPFDSEVLYRYDMDAKPPRVTMYVTRNGGSMAELAQEL